MPASEPSNVSMARPIWSRHAVPGGYARAHAKTQAEPPDEGGRHGGRPAGAQAEQAMKRGRGRTVMTLDDGSVFVLDVFEIIQLKACLHVYQGLNARLFQTFPWQPLVFLPSAPGSCRCR